MARLATECRVRGHRSTRVSQATGEESFVQTWYDDGVFRIGEASTKVWDRLQTFRREHETYTAYSIGCVITRALIWAILALTATNETRSRVFLIFAGWWVGWLSATIARAGYPPPKKRLFKRDTADPT